MVILSKLADYGVIIATHMAVFPNRQMTAAAVAEATQLPQATVAKLLKAMAHAGLEEVRFHFDFEGAKTILA